MAYADSIKYNKIRSMKGLPIGAIVPWASDQSTIPSGWVVCNGSTVASTRYPLLFDVIGNSYGGTAGSTFRLPPLTNSTKGIMDIFVGHYQYLKTNGGTANEPTSSSISQDSYWSIISGGDGNQGSNTRDTWISTIDVVGEIVGTPTFFGIYDPITISDGSFSYVAVWGETRLRAQNMPSHTHSASSVTQAPSYRNGSGRATWCTGGSSVGGGIPCDVSCSTTTAYRVAANPNNDTRVSRGNIAGHLSDNFLFTNVGSSGTTLAVGTGGGGTIRSVPPSGSGGLGESGATVYNGGDGRCVGDMNCTTGVDVLFTSLSNPETSLANVSAHSHGTVTYNLTGRYQVISPGVRDNVQLNTVRLNNDAGRNFCTITATTSTPSLDMLYIIRAF